MRMRYGFTTGSCAAAASKAAAYMLLTGKKKETISIVTPKGIVFETKLLEITRKEKSVSCRLKRMEEMILILRLVRLSMQRYLTQNVQKRPRQKLLYKKKNKQKRKHSMQPSRLTAELALAVSQDRAWISQLEMLQSIMCRAR